MPANLPAIAWDPGYDVANDLDRNARPPRLECTAADGGTRELSFQALPEDLPDRIELREPLVAGERCTLYSGVQECSVEQDLGHLQASTTFEVSESSPLPQTLGLIAVAGPKLELVELAADASCTESVLACVLRTSVMLSEAAEPWKDALLFETLVDGEPFTTWRHLALPDELGGQYDGRDAGAVYVLVENAPDNVRTLSEIAAGEHQLSMRARLPGSDLVLTTPEVTASLDCGRATQEPLARSEVPSSSGGCAISQGPGSSERQPTLPVLLLATVLLLTARRRGRA